MFCSLFLFLLRGLLTLLFRVRRADLRRGILYLGVDLAAEEDRNSREIEPEHHDNERAERAVTRAVGVEIFEICLEGERDQEPQPDSDHSPRRHPFPFPPLDVRAEIID